MYEEYFKKETATTTKQTQKMPWSNVPIINTYDLINLIIFYFILNLAGVLVS